MSAPNKANISKLDNPACERLTTSTELNHTYEEVTNYAKLWRGRFVSHNPDWSG